MYTNMNNSKPRNRKCLSTIPNLTPMSQQCKWRGPWSRNVGLLSDILLFLYTLSVDKIRAKLIFNLKFLRAQSRNFYWLEPLEKVTRPTRRLDGSLVGITCRRSGTCLSTRNVFRNVIKRYSQLQLFNIVIATMAVAMFFIYNRLLRKKTVWKWYNKHNCFYSRIFEP